MPTFEKIPKYIPFYQDIVDISSNVISYFEVFETHSFTNSNPQ